MRVVHTAAGIRCWRRRHLPAIAILAPVPLLLWSGFAGWAWAVAAAVLVGTTGLLWTDRVVVGPGYVAVRRLLRWHVVAADDLTRVSARPSAHGGIVRLDCTDGGHLLLHRGKREPGVERALQTLVERDGLRRDERAEQLLHLHHDAGRCG